MGTPDEVGTPEEMWKVPVVDPRGFVLWVNYDTLDAAEEAARQQMRAVTEPPIVAELQGENASLHKANADLMLQLKQWEQLANSLRDQVVSNTARVLSLCDVIREMQNAKPR